MRPSLTVTTLLASFAILLAGCESTSRSDNSHLTAHKLAEPGEGYLLFSFAYLGDVVPPGDENVQPYFDNYILKIRPVGDYYTTYELGLTPGNQGLYKSTFPISKGKGFLFAEPLPAGDYEIFSYVLTYRNLTKSAAISPQAVTAIPFTVSENQYTYIGRIKCLHKFEDLTTDWLNIIRPTGATFAWASHLTEDKSQAYMEFPHLIPLDMNEVEIGSQIESLNGAVNNYLP